MILLGRMELAQHQHAATAALDADRCDHGRETLVWTLGNLAGECDRNGGSGLRPRLEDLRPVRTTHSRAWSPASRSPRVTSQFQRGNSQAPTVKSLAGSTTGAGWRTHCELIWALT